MHTKKSNGDIIADYTYTLDAIGNHLSVNQQEPMEKPTLSAADVNYTYNNANRIVNAGDDSFTHDLNGNILSKSGSGGNATFSYNADDMLTGVSGVFNASYVYDANGHRRAATRNGITTRYVLDINSSMEQVLIETNASNAPQYYYIHGNGLIYRIRATDSTTQFYHYDYRGSTIAITDTTQNITHKYVYDEFGKTLDAVETDFNPYRYVGRHGVMYENDKLYFMRARFYNPDIGRFLSEDPVWKTNLFSYCSNNSLIKIDPNGENEIIQFAAELGYQIIKGKEIFYNPKTNYIYAFNRSSNGKFIKGSFKTFSLTKLAKGILPGLIIDKTSETLFGKGEDPNLIKVTNYIPFAGSVIRNLFGNVQSAGGDLDPNNFEDAKILELYK